MAPFKGFSKQVFECCKPSEKIRVPINRLKELQSEIEPRLKRINPQISGHVSKIKVAGTNIYNDWAWLYFNTIGPGAYRHSQLTVNVSPSRVYVGVNLRRKIECRTFQSKIKKEENEELLRQIIRTLGGREWIITTREESWEDQTPRWYSPTELRGILFDPELHWINACFEKDGKLVGTRRISNEIMRIFTELYNIYALASNNEVVSQPRPKSKVYKPIIAIDFGKTALRSDERRRSDTKAFLASLKAISKTRKTHLQGKRDQYFVKRIALDLDLKPYALSYDGKKAVIYSNQDVKPFRRKILKNLSDFLKMINDIEESLQLPEDFIKIMFVDPQSDARYSKEKEANCIFLNLARFEKNRNRFFWLFAVARELSYIKFPRLDYRFMNLLRDILEMGTSSATNLCG